MKKLLYAMLLVFALAGAGRIAAPIRAEAAALSVPSKVRCDVGEGHASILPATISEGDKIKNLKLPSGLKGGVYNNSIYFYAQKAGTYSVKFDVYKSNGKKRKSCSVKIYAKKGYWDSLFSSVTLDGKKASVVSHNASVYYSTGDRCSVDNLYGAGLTVYTGKTSAKVKFSMAEGLTIKKITKSSMKISSGKTTEANYKNGSSKVTFKGYDTSFSIYYVDSFDKKTHICQVQVLYVKNGKTPSLNPSSTDGSKQVSLKSFTLDGKKIPTTHNWSDYMGKAFTSKKSGKVRFAVNGATIKKITVTTYDKNGKGKSRSIKNGAEVTFSKGVRDKYDDGPLAQTDFEISFSGKASNMTPIYITLYSPK